MSVRLVGGCRFADLAKLAGGAAQITQLAAQYIDGGRCVEALESLKAN